MSTMFLIGSMACIVGILLASFPLISLLLMAILELFRELGKLADLFNEKVIKKTEKHWLTIGLIGAVILIIGIIIIVAE